LTPEEFKAIRHRLGLSAAALAGELGIGSRRTIRRWEAGERKA
jgi:DNA-binding transcriptional regulator YiaG